MTDAIHTNIIIIHLEINVYIECYVNVERSEQTSRSVGRRIDWYDVLQLALLEHKW